MTSEPTREELDAMLGTTVLEFGAGWCPICQAARPTIDRVISEHPEMRHLWIEDGKGRPLGRSFGIKVWPTLVILRDGHEVGRVVRPSDAVAVRAALSTANGT